MVIGLVATALLISASPPAELRPAVTYSGPQVVKVSSEGFTFELASGWQGRLPPDGEAMVIRHRTELGLILGSAQRATEAEARKFLASPIPIDGGLVLQPTAKVRTKGDTLTTEYQAGTYKGFALARVRRDGRSVAFIGIAPAGAYASLKSAIGRLGRSVRFGKLPKPTPERTGGGPLAQALAGRKLHRFYGDYGYREHQIMVLCKDGRFFWNMDAGGVTRGVASGAAASKGQGRWSAAGTKLKLQWDSGGQRTYNVEHRDGKLFLNGNKWLRGNAGC